MSKANRLFISLIAIAVVLAFSFGGHVATAQNPTAIAVAWPYKLPPDGHFNSFATGGILSDSIYLDLIEPPLGVYMWAQGKYEGMLADTFAFDKDNNYVV